MKQNQITSNRICFSFLPGCPSASGNLHMSEKGSQGVPYEEYLVSYPFSYYEKEEW